MKNTLTLTLTLVSFAAAGGSSGVIPDEVAIRQEYQNLANAIVKGDHATMLKIYAPQFVGWGPRYEPLTREILVETTPGLVVKTTQMVPLKFVTQGATYLVTSKSSTTGEYDMGGQKVPFTQTGQSLDWWEKVSGQWQLVGSQHLSSSVNMAGQQQIMTDPAPLSAAQRQGLGTALQGLLKPVSFSASASSSDLAFLKPLASARVIGVGEGSHGTHEHFVLKARIFKALVKQYGYTTLAFESNMAGAEAINAYISGESSDLQAAVNGLGFAVWRTAEIRDLLVWMRDYNAKRGDKPALKFVAVDMQDPAGSAKLLAQLWPAWQESLAPFAALQPYEINELVKDNAKLKAFTEQADALVKAAEALPADTARRADLVLLTRTLQQNVLAAGGQGSRDDFMAENLLNVLKADPQAKVMLWAHNAHISKAPDALAQAGMGQRLAEALGNDYRTIGQTFGSGTIRAVQLGQEKQGMQTIPVGKAHPDSPEALVRGTGALVLNDALKVPALNEYLSIPRPVRGIGQSSLPGAVGYTFEVLPKSYDVLIFSGESTPTSAAK